MQIRFTRRWPYASPSGSVGLMQAGAVVTSGRELTEELCHAAIRQGAAVRWRKPLGKAIGAGGYSNK